MGMFGFGKRAAETEAPGVETPYLSARRSWNEYVGALVSSRQLAQAVALLSLCTSFVCVGALAHLAGESKFIPYVVEVDATGRARGVGRADRAGPVEERALRAAVWGFIEDARLVTADVELQNKAIFAVYARLKAGDPATQKMTEWYRTSEGANPHKRAESVLVSTENVHVLRETEETWQVEWLETTRNAKGFVQGPAQRLRAVVRAYVEPATKETSEAEMLQNPLGIYIRDFSWQEIR